MNGFPELERARDAYADRAWLSAYTSFEAADRVAPLAPDDLWRWALSAYLIGRDDEYLRALERAHRAHLDAGEPAGAARCAFWLGLRLVDRSEIARATGWFSRAGRLVEQTGRESVEHGYLQLPVGFRHLGAGEDDAAFDAGARAVAIASRFDDADLRALAVHLQGRARLRQSRVEEGLALLDEAIVAVTTGELSPHVTGLIYCSVISACREVHALGRVREWTAALAAWCARQPEMVAYTARCRAHRAEVLRLGGEWSEAIQEARRAGERGAAGPEHDAAAAACYQEGEVHRLRGEYAAAEEAYRAASRWGTEPQPGLALLRLAQGRAEAAAAAIRRSLGETARPLKRARLLPAYIEIMVGVGAHEEARAASVELDAIARDHGVAGRGAGALDTIADHMRGLVDLAAGDAVRALGSLRRALAGWLALEAPHEVARVRELIGRACLALDDGDTAKLELEAACDAFAALGAAPDVARVDAQLRGRMARGSHGLTARELDVLRRVATGGTNKAVADALCISEKTVARHLSNIFLKLGLSSRTAAAAYAHAHDLL